MKQQQMPNSIPSAETEAGICTNDGLTSVRPTCIKHNVICRLIMLFGIKRYPNKLSKRNNLLNRKINYEGYFWGDTHRGIFAERLQILINNCTTYNQYYRCQSMLRGYIAKYGKYENDGWIFFGNRISITVRALEVQVKGIENAIGRVEGRLNGI